MGFFRKIAEAIGSASALSFKGVQLRERVEIALQTSKLMLVLDEAHYLWPQNNRRESMPGRINWVMTALVNYGVPVALVTTPQFIRDQKLVERKTGWTSEQFIGRIGHYQRLPDALSEVDLRAVARRCLPEGDEAAIEVLALYAQASAKYLSAIDTAVKRARFLASKDGRTKVAFGDIKCAIQDNVIPSDAALKKALQPQASAKQRMVTCPVPSASGTGRAMTPAVSPITVRAAAPAPNPSRRNSASTTKSEFEACLE
jgi:hypothetical protein